MKLNNYQKILLIWGGLLLVGYLLSMVLFSNLLYFFVMWFFIALIGLGIQLALGGFGTKNTQWIQLIWIVFIIGGILLNILEYRGLIPLFGGSPFIGWPLSIGLAYLIIALIYKINLSYVLLTVLYGVFAAVVFMIQDFNLGLLVSGVLFAGLCGLDAFLEGSSLRKKALLGSKK